MWSSRIQHPLWLNTGRKTYSKSLVGVNHYDILGITPKATQAEVKAAYYKLSKKHHPDTSNDDTNDADRFRLVTEAYEVLGSYRSRQLYDKGLYGHSRVRAVKKEVPEDDPKMAFYKSRFDRDRVPTNKPNQSIYNFDEWTRQHYSETITKNAEQKKNRRKFVLDEDHREVGQSDDYLVKLASIAFLAVAAMWWSLESLPSADEVKASTEKHS